MSKRIIRICSWLSIDLCLPLSLKGRILLDYLASISSSRSCSSCSFYNVQCFIICLELTSVLIAAPGKLVTPTMGSPPQKTANLVFEHYHFHTSIRRRFDFQYSEFHDVVSNEGSYTGLEASPHSLVSLAGAAWAPLLRD